MNVVNRRIVKTGFTLIELIVVMVILSLLATIGLSNFRSTQIKARDAQRKHDLEQIRRALEMYYNDKGRYPPEAEFPGPGEEWRDTSVEEGTLYMKSVPVDPRGYTYLYESDANGTWYRLYAYLENQQDRDIKTCIDKSCGGSQTCNYGVASANIEICEEVSP